MFSDLFATSADEAAECMSQIPAWMREKARPPLTFRFDVEAAARELAAAKLEMEESWTMEEAFQWQ